MFNYCVLLLVSDLMSTRILIPLFGWFPGNRNKGKGNGAGLAEKASRTALQTSSVLHTHTLLVQTHNMTTVKEIFLAYL